MAIGFVVKEWTHALKTLGVKHPRQKMEQVLSMIWDHIYKQLWSVRNNICQSNDSHTTVDEMAQLAKKLVWYKRHKTAVLDYRHRLFATFAVDDVTRCDRIIYRVQTK